MGKRERARPRIFYKVHNPHECWEHPNDCTVDLCCGDFARLFIEDQALLTAAYNVRAQEGGFRQIKYVERTKANINPDALKNWLIARERQL